MAELKSAGIPIHSGVVLEEVQGETHVESLVFRDRKGRIQKLDCDAVALGYGLRAKPSLQNSLVANLSLIVISVSGCL